MPDNLFTRFLAAPSDLDRIFLRPSNGALSFRQTFALSAQLAHVLAAHGVKPGDRVAVQAEKSATALILYLACLRIGAVYLPLNTGYTPSELAYFVQDAAPRLFVCSDKNRQRIEEALPGVEILTISDDGGSGSLVTEAAGAPQSFPDVPVEMNNLASILYTSGTTGRSKGAMLSHGNLHSNAQSLIQAWAFSQADVLLHALPIFHIHGLFVATNVSLLSAASILLLPKFDPDAVFRALPEATVMMGVPTFYTRLLKDDRLNRDTTKHMRLFVSGSAPLLAETHREWETRTGHVLLERYGMTETNMNTSNPYRGARIPGSVGLPLPGVDIRIAGGDGHPRIAAFPRRHDPRVPEDGDLRPRCPLLHRQERLYKRRIGLRADGVRKRGSVPVLAGTPSAKGREAGGAAVDDGVDEDAVVGAADRHRDQLGAVAHRVELWWDVLVLRVEEVRGLSRTTCHIGQVCADCSGDHVGVVARGTQALRRRRGIGRQHTRGGAIGVAERDVAKRFGRALRRRCHGHHPGGGDHQHDEQGVGSLRSLKQHF